MKKEDPYQLNRQQVIEEKFESTKYDSWNNQDPLTAKHEAAKELLEIKNKQNERKQTAKEIAKQNEETEIEELRKFKEEHEKTETNSINSQDQ